MQIDVRQIDNQIYELVFDETTIAISISDMERLHHQLSEILRPEMSQEKRSCHQAFLTKLKTAEDNGIQALLRTAARDDILILLHSSEQDDDLKKKLYRNLSENSRKIYMEDLVFQFCEGVPDYRFDEAIARLLKTAETLSEDGALNFKIS